ncbi:MAG: hypothetical protein WC933_00635 [Candidatus Paceibacterota bacterium]|jgi:hypothetical protein
MKIKIVSTILSSIVLLPSVVFSAGLIPCDGITVKCDFSAFAALINNILTWFIGISVSVAAITFSYAGAQILLNPDKPAKIEEGKKMFVKTALGMVFVLGAWLIVHTIVATVVSKNIDALRFLEK